MGEREELEALRAAGRQFAEQRKNIPTQQIKPPISSEEKRLREDTEELHLKKKLGEHYKDGIIPYGFHGDIFVSSPHDRHIGELTAVEARMILAEAERQDRQEKDYLERKAIRSKWERENPKLVAESKRLEEERFKRESKYSPPPHHDSGDIG